MSNSNSHYLELLDGLNDLATPDHIIIHASSTLSQTDIFKASVARIKKLFPLTSYAFLLENDEFGFDIHASESPRQDGFIQNNIDSWIEKGIFSWALNQNRAHVEHGGEKSDTAILHAITSHGRAMGMFIGFIKSENNITAGRLSLLSVILINCGKELEAYDLNMQLKQHNSNLEQLVDERTQQLQLEKEKAEINALNKSSFLSTMSHEIRTPMNGIIGMAQVLLNTDLSIQQKKYVATITESGSALTTIINDILDHSKIEAGKLELSNTPFSLTQLCKDIILLFSAHRKNNAVAIEFINSSNDPHYVIGDHGRLRQIINNFVSNAIKFTQHGIVRIKIEHKDVNHLRELHIAVSDTGTGIPTEVQEKLFKPFSQTDASIANKFGGTGLGLSICKRLVELMNGNIGVSSQESIGSTFWIQLALERPSSEMITSIEQKNTRLEANSSYHFTGKILVAEDNKINQDVIRLMLEPLGFNVYIANDGTQALKALEQNSFDLIFMDCQMPVMDGYEASRQICSKYSKLQRPPIIALTANAFASDRGRCLEAGMDGFLAKPVDRDTLIQTISQWLPDQAQRSNNPIEIKPQHQESTTSAAAPDINKEVIDRLTSLSPATFGTLKNNFINNTKQKITELEVAITSEDYKRIEFIAHSLKGSCATFGATKVASIAANIEQAGKQQQMNNMQANLTQLIESFSKLSDYFNKL